MTSRSEAEVLWAEGLQHRGCGGILHAEEQDHWVLGKTVDGVVRQEPVLVGKELLYRCTRCGLVGHAV